MAAQGEAGTGDVVRDLTMMELPLSPVSRHVWENKYQFRTGEHIHDRTPADSWRRVAEAAASAEPRDQAAWSERFYNILADFRFLPGGRILAGAGTDRQITLLNCFVMGVVEDSLDSIFDHLKEAALTMQAGGGIGFDFSALRPLGTFARGAGAIASGPVSFLEIWDVMCTTLLSTGARRGAMMASLRCDHPDIERFIDAKQQAGKLRNFNLSVQVTDAFMQAVRDDRDLPLVFPAAAVDGSGEIVDQPWPGQPGPVPCRVFAKTPARDLWRKLMRATYAYSEPGVLFIDQINRTNNLWYRERITTTNPCGEIPLPPYGACDLGSINLTRFVRRPFEQDAKLDLTALSATARLAVRLLDNVIDLSHYPLERQSFQAKGNRRIGLGVTGFADALIMLGHRYDAPTARGTASIAMREICHAAYQASIDLASEKGRFPFFERDRHLASPFVSKLPVDIQHGIARHGIRNSHLLAIAPAGSISLLANNVSSGLEPVFAFAQRRRVLDRDGVSKELAAEDYAWRLWRTMRVAHADLPASFVTAYDVSPRDQLLMQAALQAHVDSAVSKTINVPEDYAYERFQDLHAKAYELGLKGCTTFRPNPTTGVVLSDAAAGTEAPHCCVIEREAD